MGSKSKKRQAKRAEQRAHNAAPASKPGAAKASPAKAPEPKAAAHAGPIDAEEVVASIVASIVPALFEEKTERRADDTAKTVSSRKGEAAKHEEQRTHPRVSMQIEIGLGSETHFFSGLSGDVSEGGVFVQTYQEIPVGSEVELELKLPTGQLTTHGTVRWHRSKSDSAPPGVGVAFEALTDDARSAIHDFCEARAPLYYDVDHG